MEEPENPENKESCCEDFYQCMNKEFHPKNLGLDHDEPTLFVNSQWPRLPKLGFLLYRIMLALGIIAWLISNIITEINWFYAKDPGAWFTYATNWGFMMFALSFIIQAVLVTYYDCRPEKLTEKALPVPLKVGWLWYTVIANTMIVISLCFWTFIFFMDSSPYFRTDGSEIKHSLTSIIIIIDIMISAIPIRLLHMVYTICLGVIYTAFNIIFYAAHGDGPDGKPYIYSVLDWKRPVEAAVTVLLAFMGAICSQILIFEIHVLRLWIYKKLYPDGGEEHGNPDSEKKKLCNINDNSYETMAQSN